LSEYPLLIAVDTNTGKLIKSRYQISIIQPMERRPESSSALFEWGFGFLIFSGILLGIGLAGLGDTKNPGTAQGVEIILKAGLASAIIGVSLVGINKVRG